MTLWVSSWRTLVCLVCNKVPQSGCLKQQKRIVSQFWRLEVHDEVPVGLLPCEGLRKILFHSPLLASGVLLAIFGIPWLTEASTQSLPSSSRGILPMCVCAQISHFYKDTSHWMIAHPDDLILT